MSTKVTQQQIESLLDEAEVEEHLIHEGKSLILGYKLKSGFTIDGRVAIVDLSGFDIEIGRSTVDNSSYD